MKIIDFEKKGNQVKFYLGTDDLEKWYGDDWNDIPWEHNAGEVYQEFVSGTKVVTFDFDDIVFDSSEGASGGNSRWSKDDMKARKVPCICVLKKEHQDDSSCMIWSFNDIVGHKDVVKYYFGDKMEVE